LLQVAVQRTDRRVPQRGNLGRRHRLPGEVPETPVRVTSLDPALGGGCAVITADLSDQLIILDAETRYELARTEEIFALMENQIRRYHPSLVIVEYDAQQKGIGNDDRLAAMGDRYGFRVQPHLTRGQKSDEVFGVASMDQSFMKGEIRIPWG